MIDYVIPLHAKDIDVVGKCIDSIIQYGQDVGDIYVISAFEYTNQNACVKWVSESVFPFSVKDIGARIPYKNAGWYYQQAIQFYVAEYIGDITSDFVWVNSDVIFMSKMHVLEKGKYCFNVKLDIHEPYVKHIKKLIDIDWIGDKSGCTHYMIYNVGILAEIKSAVESMHRKPFWKAYIDCEGGHENGASEFDLYYEYMLTHYPRKVKSLQLMYADKGDHWNSDVYKVNGYDYVAFHAYMRVAQ